MKIEQGLVLETTGKFAEVKVGRHSDCTNCGACPGSNHVIVTANNRIGAKAGQRVEIEVKEVNVLTGAFTVFVCPLLAAAVGVFAGRMAAIEGVGTEMPLQIMGGIIGFLLSLIFVKKFDRSAAGSEASKPDIVRIL